jgi:hypothetical protein
MITSGEGQTSSASAHGGTMQGGHLYLQTNEIRNRVRLEGNEVVWYQDATIPAPEMELLWQGLDFVATRFRDGETLTRLGAATSRSSSQLAALRCLSEAGCWLRLADLRLSGSSDPSMGGFGRGRGTRSARS